HRASQQEAVTYVRLGSILLQKSLSRCCGIQIRNNRIGASALLNQRCLLALDFESIFRAGMLKILLQHYRSGADNLRNEQSCPLYPRKQTNSARLRGSAASSMPTSF